MYTFIRYYTIASDVQLCCIVSAHASNANIWLNAAWYAVVYRLKFTENVYPNIKWCTFVYWKLGVFHSNNSVFFLCSPLYCKFLFSVDSGFLTQSPTPTPIMYYYFGMNLRNWKQQLPIISNKMDELFVCGLYNELAIAYLIKLAISFGCHANEKKMNGFW